MDQIDEFGKKMPRGFDKEVERMRKLRDQKEREKLEEQKKLTGERYGKEKLDKMKPPSFLTQRNEKRQLLLSIEVSINPQK